MHTRNLSTSYFNNANNNNNNNLTNRNNKNNIRSLHELEENSDKNYHSQILHTTEEEVNNYANEVISKKLSKNSLISDISNYITVNPYQHFINDATRVYNDIQLRNRIKYKQYQNLYDVDAKAKRDIKTILQQNQQVKQQKLNDMNYISGGGSIQVKITHKNQNDSQHDNQDMKMGGKRNTQRNQNKTHNHRRSVSDILLAHVKQKQYQIQLNSYSKEERSFKKANQVNDKTKDDLSTDQDLVTESILKLTEVNINDKDTQNAKQTRHQNKYHSQNDINQSYFKRMGVLNDMSLQQELLNESYRQGSKVNWKHFQDNSIKPILNPQEKVNPTNIQKKLKMLQMQKTMTYYNLNGSNTAVKQTRNLESQRTLSSFNSPLKVSIKNNLSTSRSALDQDYPKSLIGLMLHKQSTSYDQNTIEDCENTKRQINDFKIETLEKDLENHSPNNNKTIMLQMNPLLLKEKLIQKIQQRKKESLNLTSQRNQDLLAYNQYNPKYQSQSYFHNRAQSQFLQQNSSSIQFDSTDPQNLDQNQQIAYQESQNNLNVYSSQTPLKQTYKQYNITNKSPQQNYIKQNIIDTKDTQRNRLIRPYKDNPELITEPLKSFVSKEEELRFRKDKNLEVILNDLNRASFDAESTIHNAFQSLNYLKFDNHSKNVDDLLFQKGVLYRSKLKLINNQVNEALSKKLASSILTNDQATSNSLLKERANKSYQRLNDNKKQGSFRKKRDSLINIQQSESSNNNVDNVNCDNNKNQRKDSQIEQTISSSTETHKDTNKQQLNSMQQEIVINMKQIKQQLKEYSLEPTQEERNNQKSLYELTKRELEKAEVKLNFMNAKKINDKKMKQLTQNQNVTKPSPNKSQVSIANSKQYSTPSIFDESIDKNIINNLGEKYERNINNKNIPELPTYFTVQKRQSINRKQSIDTTKRQTS